MAAMYAMVRVALIFGMVFGIVLGFLLFHKKQGKKKQIKGRK